MPEDQVGEYSIHRRERLRARFRTMVMNRKRKGGIQGCREGKHQQHLMYWRKASEGMTKRMTPRLGLRCKHYYG